MTEEEITETIRAALAQMVLDLQEQCAAKSAEPDEILPALIGALISLAWFVCRYRDVTPDDFMRLCEAIITHPDENPEIHQ